MLNTCVTSKISLRTREPLPFSTNDYSYCSNERNPFSYSSSTPYCSCCSSYPMCKSPLSQTYCYNLYGLRQSSLIQWSPYRRLIMCGYDRSNYARLPIRDVDRSCCCDRVSNFREKSVGVRKGGMVKRLVYEKRSEMYDFGGFDEAEVILSLLTEDVDEECFRVSKETRRSVKKPLVEKRESKKKNRVVVDDDDVIETDHRCECGSVVRSKKKDNSREEIIRRKEENEALLREENSALKNRIRREKEAREALLRKTNRLLEEKEERESRSRKENRKVSLITEEREDLLRREENRQKMRKDGSGCSSSYYSLSSTGDIDSDNEIEIENENENLLSGHKRNSRSNEIVYSRTREEDKRHEDYREEDYGASLTKKSTSNEIYGVSNIVESDHRKKSEKSFHDVSVEEIESRKEKSQKESNISSRRENKHEKFSDHYVRYDDTKVKSSGITKFDEESKRDNRQTDDDDVLRQSETRMKYKQHVENQDARIDDVRVSYGSQKVYSGKNDISAEVASPSQQRVGEDQAAVGLRTNREDEYRRNSRKTSEISEIQEIDIKKTSVSQQRFETSVKKEDYSSNIRSSINDAAKPQQQYGQVSDRTESRSDSQQLTKLDGGKLTFKMESDKLVKKEEKANLTYGSSSESKERHAKITKKEHSTIESDKTTKISVSQSENSGAIYIEDTSNTKSETPVRTPSYLPETGSLQLSLVSEGDSNLEESFEFQHEVYGGAQRSNSSQGQPSEFTSHQDAIDSAALLEKSSAHYVDQFVENVRNEVLSSEIQREKKTSETKLVHEEQNNQKNLVRHNSGRKGPADEMWTVNEPSIQDNSKVKVQESTSEAGNAIVKRSGKSLWNVFSDIVRLRWSPHSDSHSSGRKTGERSSPNLSTSSGTWFSGHETEQYEDGNEEKEGKSITQEDKKHVSIVKEGSSSSSTSAAPERGSQPINVGEISEGDFKDTSSAVTIGAKVPVPSLRMRRSPAVRGVLEVGEANTSDSGMSEPVNTLIMEQSESTINEGELKRRKLQRRDQVVKDRFDEWEEAYTIEAEQRKIDEMFMREALLEAQKAADMWEVPVGAVLVHNGEIIARGYNLVEEMRDSTAHAEMICIREASNMLRTWRLSETTLYVTLEPCPMCAGAILQARIDTVVWGAPNKLLGADGSWIRLFPGGNEGNNSEQSDNKPAAPIHPFHPKIIIRRGVLSSECADAMQQFFKRRRKKEKKPEAPSSSSSSTSTPSCLPITQRPSKLLTKMHGAFHFMFCL